MAFVAEVQPRAQNASPPAMVNPAVDAGPGPFSYFSKPVDEIGVMDAPLATEVTPEGSLYTGYGELFFLTGPLQTPIAPRVRTLERGYLPILHMAHVEDGIEYRFTLFTAPLGPGGMLVNFIRAVEKNTAAAPTRAVLTIATRYQSDTANGTGTGEHRFVRPSEGKHPGEYRQPGEAFDPSWVYAFTEHALLRGGKVLYLFPEAPEQRMLTQKQNYNGTPDNTARSLHIFPTTPVGLVSYDRILAPGEERTLTFMMPVVPVEEGPGSKTMLQADYDQTLARTIDYWEKLLSAGMQITTPEGKVNETFRTSLIYDLLARDHLGDNYIQTVNKLHYHAFWLRDASDIVHMYDVTGYSEYARQVLDFFPHMQQADGLYLSQPGQYDAWGEVMWAYGQHYRMTQDLDFAKEVFPSVERSVTWLQAARKADPLHLMPASFVKDNEYLAGHLTGYNLLALGGLKNAALLADAVGQPAKAASYRREYDAYRGDFLKVLDPLTTTNGGYLPAGLDSATPGQDWGNLLGTYPEHVFEPGDPRITATLKMVQGKYQEGLTTYGDGRYLHHYLMIKNTLTEIVRGEQQQPVKDLYALLLHTSATHAGFEYAIRPWGDRDFGENLSPHGWFAAEYRTMLRNMMVREDGRDVHLLSVMSPEWMGAGKVIRVERAPTEFGVVNYTVTQPDDHSARVELSMQWREKPDRILLHLPWFADVSAIYVDGKSTAAMGNLIELPTNGREVRLSWSRRPDTPQWSYAEAVDSYKREYGKRYDTYMHGQPLQ